jgi:hypothetical protein
VVRARRGAARIGCLLTLLILTAICYFGVGAGEAYYNFYRFQDRMRAEVRFAANNTDARIKANIIDFADSLGLPESAHHVTVRRGRHQITVYANYIVDIELPGQVRELHFNPSATGSF